jgi:SAM-dependent methyltransferase
MAQQAGQSDKKSVSWRRYDEESDRFFQQYEELDFSKVHRSFLRFLPPKGANCLDVGAGSGRDAIALAKRGYNVVAVEPSDALRGLAANRHSHPNVYWIKDHLPSLQEIKSMRKEFSFILLSAVWMHIHPQNRDEALATLTSLLTKDGLIAITIRSGSDAEGREMYPATVEELLARAANCGLAPTYVSRSVEDTLNRENVRWKKIVLSKAIQYGKVR